MDRVFEEKLLPLFQTMIQNQCVNHGTQESGHEDRSVETLQKFFHDYGLKGQVYSLVEGRGNLLIRIPGTNPLAPSLMLMGHMDVVPAQASDWAHPPFRGEIHQKEIWGRGAIDMLCWTAAQAVGFAEAIKKNGPFPGDLIFLAVADEEASGTYGARFLVEKHWDLVQCDYMVTELGGFFVPTDKGPAVCINLGEKGIAWLKIGFKGRAGHGSMPYQSDNATVKAAKVIEKLASWKAPLQPHPLYISMAKAFAQGSMQRWRLTTGIGEKGALRSLYKRDPGMAKFLHTAGRHTFSPNVMSAGSKVNIIADRAHVLVDIRVLPGMTQGEVLDLVKSILGPLSEDCQFEFIDWFDSNVSKETTPLMKASENLLRQYHPDAHILPIFIGGVTDGRYWRKKGTTVYGFTLFDKDLTMEAYGKRIHGADERISQSSLKLGLEYFYNLPGEFYRVWSETEGGGNGPSRT